MNKIKHILYILLVIMTTTGVAYAETIISTTYAKYPVTGINIDEIKNSLLTNGIHDAYGNVFTANTNPTFAWKYKFAKSKSGCSIKSVDIEVQISYKMPELTDYKNLSDPDKAEWDRYYTATYQHEQGHAKLSLEAAKEIEWEATNIIPKESCGEMARTANMIISNIFTHHEQKNLAYDNKTGHGTTQGAMFAAK